MSVFRFKRFEVVNERSAMKVNTDGVLLGAAMTVRPSDRRILDVGTGTGTIALMTVQRLSGANDDSKNAKELLQGGENCRIPLKIIAIDIDEDSADEAAANFRNSPWPDALEACHASLDQYARSIAENELFDHIVSNPPYFDESLEAPEERRNNARHTSTGLSYRELLDFAADRLTPEGIISMVLPSDTERDLTRHARMNGLHLFRILRIRTVPRKQPSRIIAEFSRKRTQVLEDEILTIQNEGKYTQEYLSLTRDFYLFA